MAYTSPLQRGAGGIETNSNYSFVKKAFLPYNKELKLRSRDLRNNPTLAEILFWNCVKAAKFNGYKFNRQKPLGNYIVDFYCKSLNLVVEIGGITHDDKYAEGLIRQQNLESIGLKVVRFRDEEVRGNIDAVMITLETCIENNYKPSVHTSQSPLPPFQGEEQ